MSEDAPQLPPAVESQRVEDPEKARVMAESGNALESAAANSRQMAKEYRAMGALDLAHRHDELEGSWSNQAKQLEEEAGKHYDAEQQEEAAEELGITAVSESTQIPVTEVKD